MESALLLPVSSISTDGVGSPIALRFSMSETLADLSVLLDLKFAAFFNSSVSVLTDVIFAVLPAVLLWKVQLNRRTKIATIPILSLGVL